MDNKQILGRPVGVVTRRAALAGFAPRSLIEWAGHSDRLAAQPKLVLQSNFNLNSSSQPARRLSELIKFQSLAAARRPGSSLSQMNGKG